VDHCPECGFTYASLPRDVIGDALRSVASQYRARLLGTGVDALRLRPAPEVWSPLEYSSHVRDVLVVQRERVMVALLHDAPTFEPMRRDERVVEQRDNESDPVVVAAQVVGAADVLASLLESLAPAEWERIGIYPWPERAIRDVGWMARHTVHEEVHHLFDLARSLQSQPGTPGGLGSG
jgi:S-DNA-T family DNA segregation ATPase FtsK/SpoIIIE